ncbi:MAG: hypothetical protein DRJ47_11220, partial [Thermoprotei archaeon]
MMNIAVINRYFWREGGIPIAVRRWVKGLTRKRANVVVIFASDVRPEDSDDKVTFCRVFMKKIKFLDLGGFIFAVSLFFKMWRLCAKRKFDVLMVHDSTGFLTVYILGKIYRIPAMIFFHGWIYNPFREKAYSKSVTMIYKLSAHFAAKYADAICCVSEEIAEGMRSLGARYERVYLLPNAIDLDQFPQRKKLNVYYDETKKVLYVGRFGQEKGLRYLLLAIPEVVKKVPNTELIILGGTKNEEEKFISLLKRLKINNYVKFRGKISNKQLIKIYQEAHVLVIPSLSEGHAIVPLEALACGTPVIGTQISGIKETVMDGYNGLLVEPGNHKAIADAIIKLLSNPDLLEKLSTNARPSVEKLSLDKKVEE